MTAEITTRPEVHLQTSIQSDSQVSLNSQSIMGTGDKRTYTLSYFDIKGRAETSRLLFALAEVEYTDKRISYMDWPQLKSKMPFSQVPVLEIAGGGLKTPIVLHQSHAIQNYLAREFGLAGRNNLEMTKIDMIIETMRDALQPISDIFHEKNEAKKRDVLREYSENTLPKFLDYLGRQIEDEWFVEEVSLADAAIYVSFDNISMFVPDFLEGKSYWKITEWKSRFESLPTISEWLANRPATVY